MQIDKQTATALSARLETLTASDASFAASMLSYFGRHGCFSERQRPHAERLANPSNSKPRALSDVSGILTLLQRAKGAGLKRPAFEVNADGRTLRLALAPDHGKNPGSVYIKQDGVYTGKIAPDGVLSYARDVYAEVQAKLTPALARMAADPVAAAREFGHVTGRCCFCSRRLDDARSVAVGYGPNCAERYGLAWGARS